MKRAVDTRSQNRELIGISVAVVFLVLGVFVVWFVANVVQVEGDVLYVSLLFVPILVWAIATGRLTGLKAPGGLEATFAEQGARAVNEATRDPSVALSNAIAPRMDTGTTPELGSPLFAFGTTLVPDLIERLRAAVRGETADLIEVDLAEGQRWWSTRLYLVAALADDYANVRQIVFVADERSRPRHFVGICHPKYVRRAIGDMHPVLDQAYRDAFAQSRLPGQPSDPDDEIGRVVQQVVMRVQDEESMKQWVTRESLERWLSGVLLTGRVEWPNHPIVNDELIKAVVGTDAPFVALVREGMLLQMVDRGELALSIARLCLTERPP